MVTYPKILERFFDYFVFLFGCLLLGIWYHFSESSVTILNPNDFYFFPYISDVVNRLLLNLGVYIYGVVGKVIFPAVVFFLLFKIFTKHIGKTWAFCIALLSVTSISGFPFRKFLSHILNLNFDFENYFTPVILNFPIPSFSTFCFLAVFYFAITRTNYTNRICIILTLLFSSLFYVNALDAIFGISFWFVYLFIKGKKKDPIPKNILKLSLHPAIFVAVCIPAFYFSAISDSAPSIMPDAYYFMAYFLLPSVLMLVLYFVQKIDIYEIFIKFWHIYTLMIIEILIILVSSCTKVSVNLDILQNQISLFFLHFYYYVPVVYYASRPYHEFHIGVEAGRIASSLRKTLFFTFGRLHYVYLPLFVLLLIAYNFTLALKYAAN